MRAFIAIDLEPGIKEALLSLVRGLQGSRADIRWAPTSSVLPSTMREMIDRLRLR